MAFNWSWCRRDGQPAENVTEVEANVLLVPKKSLDSKPNTRGV